MNLQDISHLIQKRRMLSPPLFTGETIPKATIEQLLENANWAPTHRKTEPWRFHIVSGAARATLGDHFQAIYKKQIPEAYFNERKYKKLKDKTLQSSHIIVIGMQRDPKESVPEWEEVAAVACAIQNFWLSAEAAGLGGYWSSPALQMTHIGDHIPLAEGETCLGFFYLGVSKDVELQGQRGDWREKVKWLE
ncbi:MAG: nitroreductase [Bacteroidota bacterium]